MQYIRLKQESKRTQNSAQNRDSPNLISIIQRLLLRNHFGLSWSYQNCLGLSLDFLGPVELAEYRFCTFVRYDISHCEPVRIMCNQEMEIAFGKSSLAGSFVPRKNSLYRDRIIARFDSCFKRLYTYI